MRPKILLVDDDRLFTEQITTLLSSEDYEISREHNSSNVIKNLRETEYDLMLLDIQMPPPDGLTLLKEILCFEKHPEIVMFSGAASLQQAADSVKLGAADFLEKPPDINRLLIVVKNCIERYRLKRENRLLKDEQLRKYEIIGDSPVVHNLKSVIRQVAGTDSRILIWGETGTGKELVASQIHYLSRRAANPLVKLNCAAIPHDLAESELFGHKKGAFTGAYQDKPGKFELADKGGLILDEIAELPPAIQSKLLRLLESSELEIIGSSQIKVIDVRLISISGIDLEKQIEAGKFRSDLYYRINTIPLRVPALRERKEDIPLLFDYFFEKLKAVSGQYERCYDSNILSILTTADWPGNIRELKNYTERLFFLAGETTISSASASDIMNQTTSTADATPFESNEKNELKLNLRRFEKNFLKTNLDRSGGNISELANRLRMDRGNLYKKLKNHGLL
jgi:two-component system, NtrC family, nitrogen regulation response regulator NtrX